MMRHIIIPGLVVTLSAASLSAYASSPHPKFEEAKHIKRDEIISHIDNDLKSTLTSADVQEMIDKGIDPPAEWRPNKGKGLGINRKYGITITGMRAPEEPPGAANPRAGMPGINSFLPPGIGLSDLIEQVLEDNDSTITATPDACGLSGQKTTVPAASASVPMPCGGTVALKETKMFLGKNGSRVGFVDYHVHAAHIYKLDGNTFKLEQSVPLPNKWCEIISCGGGGDDGGCGGDTIIPHPFQVVEQFFSISDTQNTIYIKLDPDHSDATINTETDYVPVFRTGSTWSTTPDCQAKYATLRVRPQSAAPVEFTPYEEDVCDTLQQFPRTAACDGTYVEINMDQPSLIYEPEDAATLYAIDGRAESIAPLTPTSALYTSYYSDVVLGFGEELNLIDGGMIIYPDDTSIRINAPSKVSISTGGLVTLSLGGVRLDATGGEVGAIPDGGSFPASGPLLIRSNGALPMDGNVFFPVSPGENVRFANDDIRQMQLLVEAESP